MGALTPAAPAKLFIGMISGRPALFHEVRLPLIERFGPVESESPVYPWNHTAYYEKELGPDLKRQFLFFKQPVPPDALPEIKRFTNELEQQWVRTTSDGNLRRINLDPGYLAPSKIVLATTKDYSHRIYLRDGIYAEVTLMYQGKSFHPLPHTYPDFRSEEYIALFNQARNTTLKTG
ncbi:MAG: DUF4416 family protein [Nitrospirae bacterium]|nr:DUF4416 family protein [Nitrospirota bacterium]